MIATPGKQVLTVVSAECVSRFIKHKNYISDSNIISSRHIKILGACREGKYMVAQRDTPNPAYNNGIISDTGY